ncbi:MAG: pyridoxamine 5'-phosphate oxidase family protein [Firmicutes bacterium]|nr:pyridoxamine 5'-phosphate oxidase family protein [Bacillota bacterium]
MNKKENLVRIESFIKSCGVYMVCTIDDGKPKSRPFTLTMMEGERLYFGTGTHKKVYNQIKANPYIEIFATQGLEFLRYDGKAVLVEDDVLVQKAFALAPQVKKMYTENGLQMVLFYLENAKAELHNVAKQKYNMPEILDC